jgi:hypothetical protein
VSNAKHLLVGRELRPGEAVAIAFVRISVWAQKLHHLNCNFSLHGVHRYGGMQLQLPFSYACLLRGDLA